MRLPVCVFDLESDMLCPNCQERLDKGEITQFDIDFCKWILEEKGKYPNLEKLNLLRALKLESLLVLVVKKKSKALLDDEEEFLEKVRGIYGEVMILKGPAKLRTIVRELIAPAIEVGVNSLYLPNGAKENIVMLRPEDRERITYSKRQLRRIVSAVVGESVIFQYQDEKVEKQEEKEPDAFDKRMSDFASRMG